MKELLKEFDGKIVRYWKYNRFNIWTPEQVDKCYTDEGIYEDIHCTFGRVIDCWDTKCGILLKIEICDEDYPYESFNRCTYEYLNNILLEVHEWDMREEYDDEIDELKGLMESNEKAEDENF